MSQAELVVGMADLDGLRFLYGSPGAAGDVREIPFADVVRAGLVVKLTDLPDDQVQCLVDNLVPECMTHLRGMVQGALDYEYLKVSQCGDAAWLDIEARKSERVVSLADVAAYLMATMATAKAGTPSWSGPYTDLLAKAKKPIDHHP